MEWLRKHATLILTLFVAIASLFVATLEWLWPDVLFQNGPALTLQLTSNTNLVSPEARQSGQFEVQFEGVVVPELWLGSFRLVNDGGTPILREDFDEPLRLFVPEAKILELRLGTHEPRSLRPDISFDSDSIEIKPLLLNSADVVAFSLIATKSMALATTSARIAGVNELPFVNQVALPGNAPLKAWHVVLIVGAIASYIAAFLVRVIEWLRKRKNPLASAEFDFILAEHAWQNELERSRRRSGCRAEDDSQETLGGSSE